MFSQFSKRSSQPFLWHPFALSLTSILMAELCLNWAADDMCPKPHNQSVAVIQTVGSVGGVRDCQLIDELIYAIKHGSPQSTHSTQLTQCTWEAKTVDSTLDSRLLKTVGSHCSPKDKFLELMSDKMFIIYFMKNSFKTFINLRICCLSLKSLDSSVFEMKIMCLWVLVVAKRAYNSNVECCLSFIIKGTTCQRHIMNGWSDRSHSTVISMILSVFSQRLPKPWHRYVLNQCLTVDLWITLCITTNIF